MSNNSKDENSSAGEITLDSNDTENLNTDELEKAFSKKKNKKSDKSNNLEAEHEKLKSDFLYLKAEFDNFRKNSIKERSDMVKYGAERFIRHILSVIDNFDRALEMEVNAENYEDFKQGVELTANEFRAQLENMGVRVEDPIGKDFDPNYHEALSSEETDEYKPGQISRVFQKSYMLHDRVIRPAQVVVAREISPKKDEEADKSSEENES